MIKGAKGQRMKVKGCSFDSISWLTGQRSQKGGKFGEQDAGKRGRADSEK
jgi:hypothetical protein